jgi:hypothetical protein
VCTGALLCGPAGVLRGVRPLTGVVFDRLRYFGAKPVNQRVMVDGDIITAAGVTAGIHGALTVAVVTAVKAKYATMHQAPGYRDGLCRTDRNLERGGGDNATYRRRRSAATGIKSWAKSFIVV